MSPEEIRLLTHALTRPETVLPAIEALRDVPNPAVTEALVEVVTLSGSARPITAAIAALAGRDDPIVTETLIEASSSPHSSVRVLAVQTLHRRGDQAGDNELLRVLRRDASWLVRRAALRALADSPARWAILEAATDPHWRVRHALIRALLDWSVEDRVMIEERLSRYPGERAQGVLLFLRYRWIGNEPYDYPTPRTEEVHASSFWDWDGAVLARNLDAMGRLRRRDAVHLMPSLLAHPDERVRSFAVETLRDVGETAHLARAGELLKEPRWGANETVLALLDSLDLDRLDELRDFRPPPPPPPNRSDRHPLTRAAMLTPESASELVEHPERETSWQVLRTAARLTRTPFWKFEPHEPWQPPAPVIVAPELLRLRTIAPPHPRLLGPHRIAVAPLGISGHYGLPVAGFVKSVEAGVNLMFWEPNYQTMTEFFARLSREDRRAIHVVAGTFEAEGNRVERDAQRVLRALKIDQIAVFLIFWVQSWDRISWDVYQALERLRDSGKVAAFGLSTHSRPLAIEAMASGWNPVMVRHSAAHRGAEEHVFPKAVETGTSLFAFNVTCYGRLLQPVGDSLAPSAADCLRYTLEQPGVVACWSAPNTIERLEENLQALIEPELDPDRRVQVQEHGAKVYREDTIFRKLVRAL